MTETTQSRLTENPQLPQEIVATPLGVPLRPGDTSANSIVAGGPDSGTPENLVEVRWKYCEETHQYIRHYIAQADQKATFFFAGATGLFVYLHRVGITRSWIEDPTFWSILTTLSFVTTIALVVSGASFLTTVFPRLQGSKRGIVFFGAIAEFDSADEFASEIRGQDAMSLLEQKLRHVYDLARVCRRKYRSLALGLYAGAIGVASAAALLALVR